MIRIALAAAVVALSATSAAAQSRIQTGVLECLSNPTFGIIVGSVRTMNCVFKPQQGREQYYSGTRARVGLDLGVQAGAAILWAVFAPTRQLNPGELAGTYAGVSADAAAGLGVGANALIGGSNDTITLQPLSVEGQVGVNLALGLSALTLTYQP
ncbi:MAG: DUF992 domain-containing protein [Xanthobacteraceae bacterium]